jgi:hypothetical protein
VWVNTPPGPLYGKRIVQVKKDNHALIVELDTFEEFRFAYDEMSKEVKIQARENRMLG